MESANNENHPNCLFVPCELTLAASVHHSIQLDEQEYVEGQQPL